MWVLASLRWVVCALALCLSGLAQAQDSAALQREFDAAYKDALFNPSSRTLNRRLVDLAVALEDYDAAIGAIERIIFYEPENAALQLEAARLYSEIGSFAVARGYLDDALKQPTITPDVRTAALALSAEIDRKDRPPAWSGLVQAGVRLQTNANIGSSLPGLNEPWFFEKPTQDFNSFVLGAFSWGRKLNQRTTLEASIGGYLAEHLWIDRLDLGYADLTFGPRVSFHDGGVTVKPYALAQVVFLADRIYQRALGAGAMARVTLRPERWLDAQFEYKNRVHYDSTDYPSAASQDGNLFTYTIADSEQVNRSTLNSKFTYSRNYAATPYNSFDRYQVVLSWKAEIPSAGRGNWVVTPSVGYSLGLFKGIAPPEEFAGFDTIRRDSQWYAGVNVEVPLRWPQTSIGLQIQYTSNESNLDRYTYRNLLISMGPQARF